MRIGRTFHASKVLLSTLPLFLGEHTHTCTLCRVSRPNLFQWRKEVLNVTLSPGASMIRCSLLWQLDLLNDSIQHVWASTRMTYFRSSNSAAIGQLLKYRPSALLQRLSLLWRDHHTCHTITYRDAEHTPSPGSSPNIFYMYVQWYWKWRRFVPSSAP